MFILIFIVLTFIAIWLSLKTLSICFNKRVPVTWITLLLTFSYVGALYWSNQHAYDTYRWLTDGLGILNYSFFVSLAYWIIYAGLMLKKQHTILRQALIGQLWIILVVGLCGIGTYQYYKAPTVEHFTIETNKVTRPYRFVHLSDIQYGTSTRQRMESVLQQAYALDPEFIVFTGDLVDFNYYQLSDFEMLANSPVPVYFERGNHEFYHLPEQLLHYLQSMDSVKLLIDRAVQHDELHIVGLDYSRYKSNVASKLPSLKADDGTFSIFLYHEPVEVEAAAAIGFDLLLYGHTHGGQIWPFTHVVDAIYTYADGAFTVGDSLAYTSDGASLWGPRMRLGSQNEMVVFTIKPK